MSRPVGIMARELMQQVSDVAKSDTAKNLSGTAVAMGLVATPEEAEASYIPLRAFKDAATDAAKEVYRNVKKLLDEGIDDAPGGELYQRTGAYRSEDGDIKIDVAELKARDQEAEDAVRRFMGDVEQVIQTTKLKNVGKMSDYLPENSPVFRYFPELKDTEVRIVPRTKTGDNSSLGYYTPGEETITITVPKLPNAAPEEINKRLGNIFNTLVHEFQHNIQDVKYAQNVGGGFDNKDFTKMLKSYKSNYKSAKPKLDKLVESNQFDQNNPEHVKLAQQVQQVESVASDMNMPVDDFMKMTATQLHKSDFRQHQIYIRELGEMEARSAGRKKLLAEDDPQRRAVGVFYPKLSRDPGTMTSSEILSEPALEQQDALVRIYPDLDSAFEDKTSNKGITYRGHQRHVQAPEPVDPTKIKKGVGIAGGASAVASSVAPSEALAQELGLSTERELVSEQMGLTEDDQSAMDYLEMRMGANPTTVGMAESDVLVEAPVIGDALMAADLLQMASEISPATEEDTTAEPADEFSDIPRGLNAGGGLMKNEYNVTHMRQGGGLETQAGKEMAKEKFQLDREKADLNNDGELSEYEKTRGEAIQKAMDGGLETKMAMGGMMGMMSDPFAPLQVTVDIDEHSGNEVPAGSKEEEVRDDIPALLSEGEYVVPADVVRWHGLKTFEGLRCEAKTALGLMAMHDRISYVDDDTKEPVEPTEGVDYEIEEKDKPEVEEAKVKVIEASNGKAVGVKPNYILQYRTNPQTGRIEMVYIDPMTGQQVTDFESERATSKAPADVIAREVYGRETGEEEATEEGGEEEACPAGMVRDPESGVCVPETRPLIGTGTGRDGDGRDEEEDPGPGRYGMSEEGFTLEDGAQVRSTDAIYSRIDPTFGQYTQPVDTGVLGVAFPGLNMVANLANKVGKEYKEYQIANSIRSGDYLGISPSTPDYADWRNNMAEDLAASVAESEFEAQDVVSRDRDLGGSSFGSRAEAEAVAEHGVFSDEHFDAVEAGFSKTDQFGLGDEGTDEGDAADTSGANAPGPEGTDLGDVGTSPGRDTSDNEGPSNEEASNPAGDVDSGPGSGFGYAKGGMPTRKVKPKIAMMNYNKGRK